MNDAEAPEPTLPLTVDSPISWAEVFIDHVELRRFYEEKRVRCFACCAADAETFSEGARVHAGGPHGSFDPQKIVDGLNALAKTHPFRPETAFDPGILSRVLGWIFPSKP